MKSRPWSAYLMRILCSALMFVSGYLLLGNSTFAMRLRNDVPVQAIVIAVAALLSFIPLLVGRRYMGALLVSAFLFAGIGGYWWTTIPWDEFIKDSGFPAQERPDLMDYALVASPAVVVAFYAAVSRASLLRADLKNRGADLDEVSRASCVSFLSGAALLVFCGGLAVALWALMASGVVFTATAFIPKGIPALILVAALVSVAWALITRRLPRFRRRARPKPAPAPGSATPRRSVTTTVAKARARVRALRRPS